MASHLSTVAMLVDFSASQWTARKIDKAKSAELTDANHAHEKAAHVSKKLVQADTLQAIATLVTRARDYHKANTSPWLDNGARILSAKRHGAYVEGMESFEAQFYPLVDQFVSSYPAYVARAAQQHVALGQLWNGNDYPKATRIRDKFAWRSTFLPLPDGADFRVDVGESAVAKIKAQVESTIQAAASNAIRDVFERAHEAVARMVESLTAFDPAKSGKERGTFRDSMVTNIRDLAEIMPDLNFMSDPRIDQLASDMIALTAHDAEDLRESDNIRAGVLAKAGLIAQSVSDFMA